MFFIYVYFLVNIDHDILVQQHKSVCLIYYGILYRLDHLWDFRPILEEKQFVLALD